MKDLTLYEKILSTKKIQSKNIGIIFENDELIFCIIDFAKYGIDYLHPQHYTWEIDFACTLDGKEVDTDKAIPLNSLFYKKYEKDDLVLGEEKSCLCKVESNPVFTKIKTDKSISFLKDISEYKEDELVFESITTTDVVSTVKIRAQEVKLITLKKYQSKINKLEKKSIKEQDLEDKILV